jgi:hypothetical protein
MPPPSASVDTLSDQLHEHFITLLKIPRNLATRGDTTDVRMAYKKYTAYLAAKEALDTMILDGSWQGKKPTVTSLIEVFVSKSVFHKNWKLFQRLEEFPDLLEWFEGSEDGAAVWGIWKSAYAFTDLSNYYKRKDKQAKHKKEGKKPSKAKPAVASSSHRSSTRNKQVSS